MKNMLRPATPSRILKRSVRSLVAACVLAAVTFFISLAGAPSSQAASTLETLVIDTALLSANLKATKTLAQLGVNSLVLLFAFQGKAILAQMAQYPQNRVDTGAPINVVKAKTVDLLVPAEAEIVIEGLIDTVNVEPEGPFARVDDDEIVTEPVHLGERQAHHRPRAQKSR